MSETMTELKPCPFCGGEPKLVSGPPGCHFVQCPSCGAAGDDRTRDKAIAIWNHRTPDAAALSAAEARGREAAAKWHDDAAADARERSRQARMDGATSITRLTFDLTAQSHDTYAAAIRKGLTP